MGISKYLKKSTQKHFQQCCNYSLTRRNRHKNVACCSFKHECKLKPILMIGKEAIKRRKKECYSESSSSLFQSAKKGCARSKDFRNRKTISANDANESCYLEIEEETSPILPSSNSHNSGCKIASMDLDRQWAKSAMNRARKHKCCTGIKLIGREKMGYELVHVCKCDWCSEVLEKRGSRGTK